MVGKAITRGSSEVWKNEREAAKHTKLLVWIQQWREERGETILLLQIQIQTQILITKKKISHIHQHFPAKNHNPKMQIPIPLNRGRSSPCPRPPRCVVEFQFCPIQPSKFHVLSTKLYMCRHKSQLEKIEIKRKGMPVRPRLMFLIRRTKYFTATKAKVLRCW